MTPKLKWNVAPKPTGRFRSFEKRSWPMAEYPNGQTCAMIQCTDEYIPAQVKIGRHAPLTILIADYEDNNHGSFSWKRVNRKCATLEEAKHITACLLTAHPKKMPKEYQ